MWSDSFTRPSNDLGSITDEIVRRIADTLHGRFGARVSQSRAMSSVGTTDAAALDLYLIGQAQLRQRGPGVTQSIESFQRAIGLDPRFARAHAALANALGLDPFFTGTPPSKLVDLAVAESERALTLDSTLADAYVAQSRGEDAAIALAQGMFATGDGNLRSDLLKLYQSGVDTAGCAVVAGPRGPALNPQCDMVRRDLCAGAERAQRMDLRRQLPCSN